MSSFLIKASEFDLERENNTWRNDKRANRSPMGDGKAELEHSIVNRFFSVAICSLELTRHKEDVLHLISHSKVKTFTIFELQASTSNVER